MLKFVPAVLLLLPWTPPAGLGAAFPDSYTLTPLAALALAGRLAVAAWIWTRDRWLGAAVAYLTVWSAVLVHVPEARLHAQVFMLGAGALVLMRQADVRWAKPALLASAALMVVYALVQWTVGWDPLMDWHRSAVRPVAMFGNERYFGAFLAPVIPLAPWWLAAPLTLALIFSHSWLALGAAIIGLVVAREQPAPVGAGSRWSLRRREARAAIAAALVAVLASLVWTRGVAVYTLRSRVEAWKLGIAQLDESWARVLFGFGPGGWAGRIPQLQYPGEMFTEAHNEYVQWIFETGLVGVVLLALWLAHLRIRPGYGGAVAAIAVLCVGLHVFHWAPLAPALVMVLGLGTTSVREAR